MASNGTRTDTLTPPDDPREGGARVADVPRETPAGGTGAPLPTPPARTGRDGKPLPDQTKVDLDLAHRLMIEDYADWYYPLARPTSDQLVHELLGIGYLRAKRDQQRVESPDDRIARMGGDA